MSPEEMANSMINNIEAKTGNTLQHWKKVIADSALQKHGQITKMLKSEHGITHGFANLIAHKFLKSDAGSANSTSDLVVEQYVKGKEHLKPIYDMIAKKVQQFGNDVELAPKKSYVSLRRKKQFALVQPSTKSRVDIGINIKGKEPERKLEASGSWNSMVSHRVRITDISQLDDNVFQWLREAYENAG